MRKIIIALVAFWHALTFSQAVPNEVKKTVAFIYAKNSENKLAPLGTGFFIGVPVSNSNPNGESFIYFITAKHVLKDNTEKFFSEVYVRLNKRDSSSEILRLPIVTDGKMKNIFTHDDETVDIAVIPASPNNQIFDYLFLPSSFLTKREDFKDLKISEGTDVFFSGMFTPYLGIEKNYPIFRFGRVALVSDEKIPWDKDTFTELYLIESSTFGGNSGSPVFFYFGTDRGDGGIVIGQPQIKLAGIMKGYFGENSPVKIVETKKIPVYNTNLGIAAVVPSYFIEEIINSDELKKLREKQ